MQLVVASTNLGDNPVVLAAILAQIPIEIRSMV